MAGSRAGGLTGRRRERAWVALVGYGVPGGRAGLRTQPDGDGAAPLSQKPSPSKLKMPEFGDREIGIGRHGEEESFLTPMSESSELSYGPWLASCRTVVPLLTSIRNWQPTFAPTGGHCVN